MRGKERTRARLPLLIILSLVVCYLLVIFCWPEGAAYIRKSIPAAAVLNDLAAELLQGEPVVEALSDFLKVILHDPV